MQEGIEDKIRRIGHWRVNLRPLKLPAEKLSMDECHGRVNSARVSLRGWDYPHIQRNQENGGFANVGEYAENWCDWYHHIEFWRMYRSSQFLHYRALWEDLENEEPRRVDGPILSVLGAIYTVTEIIEFASRLYQEGLYLHGVNLQITLHKTQNRQLWFSEGRRVPFSVEKRTQAKQLDIEREISQDALDKGPMDQSADILLELFDHFGWNPDLSLIHSEQEKFYKRQL
jgi:hypothetical protein